MEAVAQTEKQGRKDNGSDDEEGQQQGPAAAKAGKRGVGKAAAAAAGAGISSKIDKSRCTCEVQLSMELSSPKLLMLEVAEKVAAQAMVRATAGIDRCYVIESQRGEPTKVQTDGINFPVSGGAEGELKGCGACYGVWWWRHSHQWRCW